MCYLIVLILNLNKEIRVNDSLKRKLHFINLFFNKKRK